MKKYFMFLLLACLCTKTTFPQNSKNHEMNAFDTIKIASHLNGLKLGLLHLAPNVRSGKLPVLFIHGSTLPSALSFGFKMGGYSWMNQLSDNGYETYALDFLGYGNSDRYPQMMNNSIVHGLSGRATDAIHDIDAAVNYILKRTGEDKLLIIAHSWGCTTAAMYTGKHPEHVERLVLYAPLSLRSSTQPAKTLTNDYDEMTPEVRVNALMSLTPGGQPVRLEPEVLDQWKDIWLGSDPIAKINNQRIVRFPSGPEQDIEDLQHGKAIYDPALIKVPVMIVRGEWDTYPSNEDAGRLFSALTNTPLKKYVTIEKGSHVVHLEKSRTLLYNEVLYFLSGSSLSIHTGQIAVIFEVLPNPGEIQEYLDIAAKLKPELVKIDGFISIERFQSLTNPEKILSLSFWRDEQSILKWRSLELHREAQTKGRNYIFKDYHLRIADVVRNYGMTDRQEAPTDSKAAHTATEN